LLALITFSYTIDFMEPENFKIGSNIISDININIFVILKLLACSYRRVNIFYICYMNDTILLIYSIRIIFDEMIWSIFFVNSTNMGMS
jgi:hypothetical protein